MVAAGVGALAAVEATAVGAGFADAAAVAVGLVLAPGSPAGARRLHALVRASAVSAINPMFTARPCQETRREACVMVACLPTRLSSCRQGHSQFEDIQCVSTEGLWPDVCIVVLQMQKSRFAWWRFACFVVLAAALGAGACAEPSVELPEPFTRVRTERKIFPVRVPLRLDILFVVDTSPLMQGMRANLAAQVSNFSSVLHSLPGGLSDLHIAVISSDMGTAGGTPAAGCSSRGDNAAFYTGGMLFTDGKAYLADGPDWGLPGQRSRNFQGPFTDALVNMLTLPPSTCRYAQPLRAISRALFPLAGEPGSVGNQSGAGTAGFIRSDAQLVVVVISANDDCSLAPEILSQQIPDSEATAFRCFANSITCDEAATTIGPHHNCRPDPKPGALSATTLHKKLFQIKNDKSVIISLIAGDVPDVTQVGVAALADPAGPGQALIQACSYANATSSVVATPSLRLMEFGSKIRNHSTTTICKEDLSDALSQIAQTLNQVLGAPCFDGKLAEPFDCAFTEYRDFGEAQQRERLLPWCDAGKSITPCVSIEVEPDWCPAPSSGLAAAYQSGRNAVFPGTVVGVECVTTD